MLLTALRRVCPGWRAAALSSGGKEVPNYSSSELGTEQVPSLSLGPVTAQGTWGSDELSWPV